MNATGHGGGKLVTPTKDPAIAKLVNDFNAATGVKDKGAMALLSLLGYCNTHASTKLGDVSASNLVAMVKKSGFEDQLERWYKQSLDACGSKSQCVGIVASYRSHAISCNAGDQQACSDMDRDLKDLNQYNSISGGASSSPQQSQADALQTCLQNTAQAAAQYCSDHNQCDGAVMETVKIMQESQCGYSAIKLPEPPSTSTSHCTTSPAYGGGWTTDCTQQ
ncbi:hypothetical protein [Paraburkholderia hospita]|uniref:hypothetical protein n=1 Tax=Paraburkholderia hospita TaxID=169430 RepID=UPI00126035CF|nr:hypothetical protein [Paraburkholderia hospita]